MGRRSFRSALAAAIWTPLPRLLPILLLLMWTPAATPLEPTLEQAETDAVMVGFIYRFTQFIHWPPKQPSEERGAFVVAVIGDDAMADQLAVLEREGRRVDGLPVRVERVADPAAISACSILFVGAAAADRLDSIVQQAAGRPVLLVGDTPGLARRGVAVNFYLQRGRVRFEINPAALRQAGLTAEAQLFDVARIVE